jgi:rubrerythrin
MSMDRDTLDLLHAARTAEKLQSLFYRALAAAAEDAEDLESSERLNGLHADEQHHLSRLTVRLVELNEPVGDVGAEAGVIVQLQGWEDEARRREREEIARYTTMLERALDGKTRGMIEQFVEAERRHEEALGGKWMGAEPW